MSDPQLDQELREFLGIAKRQLIGEHTLTRLHDKVDKLHETVKTVADSLTAHVLDCQRNREGAVALAASTNSRLVTLEAGNGRRTTPTPPASLPPVRSREDSSHDLKEVAGKAMVAAIEGFRSPDKTPEEMVAKVVEEEQRRRDERRRLEELEAAEAQRLIDARERRKFWRTILVAAVSGGGALTGAFEALKSIVIHH